MTVKIQNLHNVLSALIFKDLEFKDLIGAMKVCKAWKQIVENHCFLSAIKYDGSARNLVMDVPRDLVIDRDVSVAGALLIRAANIYSKPGVCLTGNKVTLVSNRVRHLGPVNAEEFDRYSNGPNYIKGPMPGGSGGLLKYYGAQPGFWDSLVNSHST